jgi:hypothetical protein
MKFRFVAFFLPLSLGLMAASCQESAGGFRGADKSEADKTHVKTPEEKGQQVAEAPPDFTTAMTMAQKYDATTGELVVTLSLKDGFHAYAPGEEIGKPVRMSVAEAGGWKVEGDVKMPAGKTKDLGELGKSQVLEGAIPVSALVKGGSGEIQGEVEVQICTDNACDRPRKHAFKVPTS